MRQARQAHAMENETQNYQERSEAKLHITRQNKGAGDLWKRDMTNKTIMTPETMPQSRFQLEHSWVRWPPGRTPRTRSTCIGRVLSQHSCQCLRKGEVFQQSKDAIMKVLHKKRAQLNATTIEASRLMPHAKRQSAVENRRVAS